MKSSIVYLSVVCLLLFVGCTDEQLSQADRTAGDVNNLITAGQGLLATPAAAALPPDWRLYGLIILAAGEFAVGAYKQWRLTLMTKTTKAIVKGIERSEDKVKTNPSNPVKDAIKKEMQTAGIYDQANQLVDQLKIAR